MNALGSRLPGRHAAAIIDGTGGCGPASRTDTLQAKTGRGLNRPPLRGLGDVGLFRSGGLVVRLLVALPRIRARRFRLRGFELRVNARGLGLRIGACELRPATAGDVFRAVDWSDMRRIVIEVGAPDSELRAGGINPFP